MGVFPTPVGVFPTPPGFGRRWHCLPHARGGVSPLDHSAASPGLSSPRPWGCFPESRGMDQGKCVFPTPVGVFLVFSGNCGSDMGLPHARGGVSRCRCVALRCPVSSPRPWGCFSSGCLAWRIRSVFPTPVGVFLAAAPRNIESGSLPHARGGVSALLIPDVQTLRSSPRPWGCFGNVVMGSMLEQVEV